MLLTVHGHQKHQDSSVDRMFTESLMATGPSALELTRTNTLFCQEEVFIDMPMVLRQAVAHCRIWGLILVSSCPHVEVF